MEEFTVKGICLRANDSGESDRTVRLFCEDGEIRSAVMRGVKKANAKLKFAAQPFAFCEYSLYKRGAGYIVKNCMSIADTFLIASDLEKYLFGSVLLEAAEVCAQSREPQIFIELLKSLQALMYLDVLPIAEATRYILACLKICGLGDNYAKPEKVISVADYFGLLLSGEYPLAERALQMRAFRVAVADFNNRLDCLLKTPSMAAEAAK